MRCDEDVSSSEALQSSVGRCVVPGLRRGRYAMRDVALLHRAFVLCRYSAEEEMQCEALRRCAGILCRVWAAVGHRMRGTLVARP